LDKNVSIAYDRWNKLTLRSSESHTIYCKYTDHLLGIKDSGRTFGRRKNQREDQKMFKRKFGKNVLLKE